MLTRRLIACLDVRGNRVVKGTRFRDLRDAGDPATLAERYELEGADEIMFLDISATAEDRRTLLDVARQAAERIFVPLTIGGGIVDVDDVGRALRAGADKVSINSAAVRRPALLTDAARSYGSQCIVASIDVRRGTHEWGGGVFIEGGRVSTGLDPVAWARECASRGAGEILLTSIDRDGSREGYDLALTAAVADAVGVPVIASGGAGRGEHVCDALERGADAALVAGILHDGTTTVRGIKSLMAARGLPVRMAS